MSDIDVYLAPITSNRGPGPSSPGTPGRSLVNLNTTMTNMTGHPGIVVRNGINAKGQPTSMTFTGKIYGEAAMLALAHACQMATDWHEKHPPLNF